MVADLVENIRGDGSEFLLFAVTPPRLTASPERAQEIADATLGRLAAVDIDGLVLYDIDDESDRNPAERPFPFLPTLDPADYLQRNLTQLAVPPVIYRAVGKYPEPDLRRWLEAQNSAESLAVFVGASSRERQPTTTLSRAMQLRSAIRPDLLLGGVAIPERHSRSRQEHLRLVDKQSAGCSFFVTQVVYDVNAAKDLISDYRYEGAARGLQPVPLVFTFSVCGSVKTLEFLQWLGVDVPRWIQNDLRHADDTLAASYDVALRAAMEIISFCRRVRVPFGINVESVSTRADEIEASVNLAAHIGTELRG